MSENRWLGWDGTPLRFWEYVAFCGYLLGLVAIGIFAWSAGSLAIFGVLWILGSAAWLVGTVLGFLFGIPRVRSEEAGEVQRRSADQPGEDGRAGTGDSVLASVNAERAEAAKVARERQITSIVPNTNLEQISDWLTKIIVGATLVQLGDLLTGIEQLSIYIGQNLLVPADGATGGEPVAGGAVAGGGVMVFFLAAGFLWGYLWCSLRVFREMQALVEEDRKTKAPAPR